MTKQQMKDKVKELYPKARAESYTKNGPFKQKYWLIWSSYKRDEMKRLGEGKNAQLAWTDAYRRLLTLKNNEK